MADRTLYVTDLDGTLLTPDKRLGDLTVKILEGLINDGELITCATARSWSTVQRLLGSFRFELPMVLYNGTFTYDAVAGRTIARHELDTTTVQSILEACRAVDQPALVYWLDGETEQVSWVTGVTNPGMDRFWADRPADPRNAARSSWESLPIENVFNLVAIGKRATLERVLAALERETMQNFTFHLQSDTYHPQDTYLEIAPAHVSKAEAVKELAESLNATKLVVFGDNMNDLPMFAIADESYAVSNAVPEVLQRATGVVGSNQDDGVARWLQERCQRRGAANG